MPKDTSRSADEARDLLARAKVVEFEYQPPVGTRPITPVPVATLKLEPGQTVVLMGGVFT